MVWTAIIIGDARKSILNLESDNINTIITSPPYYGLRDYGVEGQIGLEQTPREYVDELVAVFRECHRVLKHDGTLWLVIGDSYAANRTYQVSQTKHQSHSFGRSNATKVPEGCKPKDLIGIPWMLAFALRDDGWYLRSDIIWHKPNALPESVKDRPTSAYEHVFLFAKSEKYYYDSDSVREVAQNHRKPGRNIKETHHYGAGNGGNTGLTAFIRKYHNEGIPEFRNRRNVWSVAKDDFIQFLEWKVANDNLTDVWQIATKPFKGAHFAVFPPDLIEPCIKAGSSTDGIILDPFGGSGTTAIVANHLGRNAILLEINPDYGQMTYDRMVNDGIDRDNIHLVDGDLESVDKGINRCQD